MLPENEAVYERQFASEWRLGDVAEIGITIFGPNRPIVGNGIFDAPARGPSDARVRDGRNGSRQAGEEARRNELHAEVVATNGLPLKAEFCDLFSFQKTDDYIDTLF